MSKLRQLQGAKIRHKGEVERDRNESENAGRIKGVSCGGGRNRGRGRNGAPDY